MAVVSRPRPDIPTPFSGLIHIERVSELQEIKKESSHQRFSHDLLVNNMIKNRDWISLANFDGAWTAEDIIDIISMYYNLDSDVANSLELQYSSFVMPRNNNNNSPINL